MLQVTRPVLQYRAQDSNWPGTVYHDILGHVLNPDSQPSRFPPVNASV